MKRFGEYALGFLFLLFIGQVVILAPKTVEEPKPAASMGPRVDQRVDQVMRGAHLVETREGEKEWELWSDEALSFRSLDQWTLKEVKAIFFGKNGVQFTVTGRTGKVETKTKNMNVEGQVVTRSSNGYVFQSESVSYDSVTRTLKSPNTVKMIGPNDKQGDGLKLGGRRMSCDLNTSLVDITGEVRGEKTFSGQKRLLILSERAQFSAQSNLARFLGHVVIDIETIRITGPSAEFAYDSTQQMVTSLLVSGGVRVSDYDKWATSDRLKVNFADESYVFQGHPRVVQNNDELVGEEIILSEGGKKIKVEGARARMEQRRLERPN